MWVRGWVRIPLPVPDVSGVTVARGSGARNVRAMVHGDRTGYDSC